MALETGGSLFWKTGLNNSGLQAGANSAVNIIGAMGNKIGKINPFMILGIAATAAFAKISSEATQFALDFEDAMKEVETISKATQENFEGISDALMEMSTIVPEAGDKLAKAYYQTVSAGYDGARGLKVLEVAAKAATAGVTDTFVAVDGITTAMNSWNMGIEQADYVADQFFKTVELGKTTFPELARNLADVAPIASASGISLREIMEAMSVITASGTPTSVAFTQIRSSILGLNETFGDGWRNVLTYQEAAQRLFDNLGGSQTKIRQAVGRVEGMNAILALSGENAHKAAKAHDEFTESVGSASEAFDIMMEKTSAQTELLKNNIMNSVKPLGTAIAGYIGEWAKGINAMFDLVDDRFDALDREGKLRKMFDPIVEVGIMGVTGKNYWDVEFIREQLGRLGIETEKYEKQLEYLESRHVSYTDKLIVMNRLIIVLREEMIRLEKAAKKTPEDPAIPEQTGSGFSEEFIRRMTRTSIDKAMVELGAYYGTFSRRLAEKSSEFKEKYGKYFEEKESIKFENIGAMAKKALDEYEKYLNKEVKARDRTEAEKEAIFEELALVRAEWYRRELEHIQDISNAIGELGDLIGLFDDNLADLAKSASSIVSDAGKLKQAFDTENTWAMYGAGASIATTYITAMQSIFSQESHKQERIMNNLASLDVAINRNTEQLRRSMGEDVFDDLLAVYESWKVKYDETIKELRNISVWNIQSGDKIGTLGRFLTDEEIKNLDNLTGILKDDHSLVRQLQSDLLEAEGALFDFAADYREILTGTTQDAITDSITDGFMEGLDSAQNFGDNFEDIMRGAMVGAFKRDITSNVFSSWYEDFTKKAKDGLEESEISILGTKFFGAIEDAEMKFEKLNKVFTAAGFNLTDAADRTGMKGALTGMSEKTAGVLEGQFGAIRTNMIEVNINTYQMAEGINDLLIINSEIADNTSYNHYLKSINEKIAKSSPAQSLEMAGLNARAGGI